MSKNYLTSSDPHELGLCRGYVVSFAFGAALSETWGSSCQAARVCGLRGSFGGPLGNLGLQLPGVCGLRGLFAFGAAISETWGSSCRGYVA